MLTHSKIRDYPQLQTNLIEKIKDKKIDDSQARTIVYQTINDVETGYLRPLDTGKGYLYGNPEKRDVINKSIEKQPNHFYMKSHTEIIKLLFCLTGRSLSKGEIKYTEDIIKNTHNHRLEMAKSLDSEYRALYGFYSWYLKPLKMAVDDMVEIMNEEMDTAEKKKEMMKK